LNVMSRTQRIFSASLSLVPRVRQLTVVTLVGVASASVCAADQSEPLDLNISVLGLQSSDGQVVAQLFREGDDVFAAPRLRQTKSIVERRTLVVFPGLEAGRYAAIVFHDINGNGQLEHNVLRLPAEPLGFSNGFQLGLFSGMPNSHKLAFTLSRDKQYIDILVR
jgi:uncharacterized protein (DUF2141 family)